MKLPLEAFVYSMEMFAQTMRGIQHIVFQGIDTMADWDVRAPVDASGSESAVPEVKQTTPEVIHAVPEVKQTTPEVIHTVPEYTDGGHTEVRQVPIQEERKMSDRDMRDDMLKLVRYKILFVKRDLEHAFPEKEELVSENTDTAGYTAWKVAEFIQKLQETPIPDKWRSKKYPRDVPETGPHGPTPMIDKLDEDDKKYLRVYFEVLERYPRERFKYEERQIEVLEQIRDKIT
jgi:hypothetical protein